VLNLISQLPKRLCFRNRPWRKKVAINISKYSLLTSDQSSSFPSRSCLFSAAAIYSLTIFSIDSSATRVVLCLLAAGPILFSRTFLGAHYLSDCIVGFAVVVSAEQASGFNWFVAATYQSEYLDRLLRSEEQGKA